jgi:hypothetical protein
MSEFMAFAIPSGDGTLDCIFMPASASAASRCPALSPTRGSGAVDVLVTGADAHASAEASRAAAVRRAATARAEFTMGRFDMVG